MMAEKIRRRLSESLAAQEFLAQEMRFETLAAPAQPLDKVGQQHLRTLGALVAPTRKAPLQLLVPGLAYEVFLGEKAPKQRQALDVAAFVRGHAEHRIDGEIR